MRVLRFVVMMALMATCAAASTEPSRWPAPSSGERAVVDEAQIFDSVTLERLEGIADLAAGRGLAVELVTLASLRRYGALGLGADGFAARLDERLAQRVTGPERRLLVVLALSEQRLGVELGGDWGRRAAGRLDELLAQQIEPVLAAGEHAEALELLVLGVVELAQSGEIPPPAVLSKLKRSWPWLLAGGALVALTSLLLGGRESPGWWIIMLAATVIYWPLALPSREEKVLQEADQLVRARGQF